MQTVNPSRNGVKKDLDSSCIFWASYDRSYLADKIVEMLQSEDDFEFQKALKILNFPIQSMGENAPGRPFAEFPLARISKGHILITQFTGLNI
jgi:hypothetical protein